MGDCSYSNYASASFITINSILLTYYFSLGLIFTILAQWYNEVEEAGFKSINTVSITVQNHQTSILNFFDNRSTNALAETFNAKTKVSSTQFRGVNNIEFFLYSVLIVKNL